MKFSINQKTLAEELAHAQSIIGRAAVIPILLNVLLEAVDEETIRFTATDLDTTRIALVPAVIAESGKLCLPAKKFFEIVRLLPRGEISVTAAAAKPGGAKTGGRIVCGTTNFFIAGAAPDVFPVSGALDQYGAARQKTALPSDMVRSFVRHTSFAMTDESSRFTLSGAKFELRGRTARMVTTDGHRLAYIETILENAAPFETDALIPRTALAELIKLDAGDDGAGEIAFWEDANHLYFESPRGCLVTRKLSGAFPDYQMVIPKDNDHIAVFEALDLLEALNRVSQMSDERTHSISLIVRPNEMEITGASSEEGDASETIPIEYSGEELKIKFQHEYVRDFISSFKNETESKISMSFRNNREQTVFRPVSTNGVKLLGVIMPLVH